MVKPRIHIMSNVYWAEPWLPRFLKQLDNLDYPKDRLQYSFSCAPHPDNTMKILNKWLEDKDNYYLRMTKMPHSWPARRRMWTASNYSRKFAVIDSPEQDKVDFIFHSDSDVIHMPSDTLTRLVNLDVDIVHPYIYVDPENVEKNPVRGKRIFYDTFSFRFLYGPHANTFPPPSGWADWYKDNIAESEVRANLEKRIIPMESVGANPVLIKREVADNVWYDGASCEAIVGFCNLARNKGYKIWSYPDIECLHSWESIYSRPDI